jgi:hypothetical protein
MAGIDALYETVHVHVQACVLHRATPRSGCCTYHHWTEHTVNCHSSVTVTATFLQQGCGCSHTMQTINKGQPDQVHERSLVKLLLAPRGLAAPHNMWKHLGGTQHTMSDMSKEPQS